jgi:hypothetical protein
MFGEEEVIVIVVFSSRRSCEPFGKEMNANEFGAVVMVSPELTVWPEVSGPVELVADPDSMVIVVFLVIAVGVLASWDMYL